MKLARYLLAHLKIEGKQDLEAEGLRAQRLRF